MENKKISPFHLIRNYTTMVQSLELEEREMKVLYQSSEIGTVGLVEEGEAIVQLIFENEKKPPIEEGSSPLLREAALQLRAYLNHKLYSFSIPLAFDGTDFLESVWRTLQILSYGETVTYQTIAKKINCPRAARAVGLACHRNPIPIFIPCHRVVGSRGKITGYRGGLMIKQRLLFLEKNDPNKLNLESLIYDCIV